MEQLPVPLRGKIRYNEAEKRRMPCVRLMEMTEYSAL